jgi:hypothetical protein
MTHSRGAAGADPDWLPPEINTDVAHPARVYDYWLGGKDNFPADRALAEHIMQAIPTMRAMAQANRAFLIRVVRYLAAEAGVRQFLDIGTGIPTSPNVHEIAQAVAPDARVVYVDNDPIVLAPARALLKARTLGRPRSSSATCASHRRSLTTRPLGACSCSSTSVSNSSWVACQRRSSRRPAMETTMPAHSSVRRRRRVTSATSRPARQRAGG